LAAEDSLRFAATSLSSTVFGKKDKQNLPVLALDFSFSFSQCTSSARQLIVRDGNVSENVEELFSLTLPLKL
jgi:hypothetical protein